MSGTICIVDDEPAILNALSSILEDEGYQVTIAKTGSEALRVIQQEPPDVVLLNVYLPEIDGLEVLKRVGEQFPNVPVIMMSGYGSVETAVKAIKLGAYDYAEKPLDLEKVPILIRNAMNQHKLEEEIFRDRPNIFNYATKELSQDAMICWLLKWSEQENQSRNQALHDCGVRFVRALLEKHGRNLPGEISEVKIYPQESSIDVLARINGKQVLLIEDKTDTMDHSNQLKRYYDAVIKGETELGKLEPGDLYPIYLKTGNQPLADDRRIEKIENCNYKMFDRADFLNALSDYAGHNSLLVDFRQHLQDLEDQTNSYAAWTQSDRRDNWPAWEGFYRCLERALFDGTQRWNGWGYVPNKSGGFLGFWWWLLDSDELYLQIETKPGEETKLCFKINAEGKTSDQQQELKWRWHEQIMAAGAQQVVRPTVMRRGQTMTVACWEDEWLAFDKDGRLDISNTVENLRRAESVLKTASRRRLFSPKKLRE